MNNFENLQQLLTEFDHFVLGEFEILVIKCKSVTDTWCKIANYIACIFASYKGLIIYSAEDHITIPLNSLFQDFLFGLYLGKPIADIQNTLTPILELGSTKFRGFIIESQLNLDTKELLGQCKIVTNGAELFVIAPKNLFKTLIVANQSICDEIFDNQGFEYLVIGDGHQRLLAFSKWQEEWEVVQNSDAIPLTIGNQLIFLFSD